MQMSILEISITGKQKDQIKTGEFIGLNQIII